MFLSVYEYLFVYMQNLIFLNTKITSPCVRHMKLEFQEIKFETEILPNSSGIKLVLQINIVPY